MVSTEPRASALTDDIVRFNIERKHSLCAFELVDYVRRGLEWDLFHTSR